MTSANLQSLISNLVSGDDEVAEVSVVQIAAFGEFALPALFDLLDLLIQKNTGGQFGLYQ